MVLLIRYRAYLSRQITSEKELKILTKNSFYIINLKAEEMSLFKKLEIYKEHQLIII